MTTSDKPKNSPIFSGNCAFCTCMSPASDYYQKLLETSFLYIYIYIYVLIYVYILNIYVKSEPKDTADKIHYSYLSAFLSMPLSVLLWFCDLLLSHSFALSLSLFPLCFQSLFIITGVLRQTSIPIKLRKEVTAT